MNSSEQANWLEQMRAEEGREQLDKSPVAVEVTLLFSAVQEARSKIKYDNWKAITYAKNMPPRLRTRAEYS